MKVLNALHNLYCDDMTYQEYWDQCEVNGQFSELKKLVEELNTYALLRQYKFCKFTSTQEAIEIEFNKRVQKKYRG